MDSGCFSFDLATMMSLRICISVCRVFASGVGFVCLCPGSGGVCGGGRGGLAGVCVLRDEVGGGEDTRG